MKVVLIIGNTGAGKSTLCSLLVTNQLKYVYNKSTNTYMVGGDEIISAGTDSFTTTPNIRFIEGTIFIDCPGFKDTKGLM